MVFFSFSMAVWLLMVMIDVASVSYCCCAVASWALCQEQAMSVDQGKEECQRNGKKDSSSTSWLGGGQLVQVPSWCKAVCTLGHKGGCTCAAMEQQLQETLSTWQIWADHFHKVIDHFLALRQRAIATTLGQLGDLHQQEINQQDEHNTALLAEMWELEHELRVVDKDLQQAQGARTAAEARVAELNACLEELFAEEEMEEREQELAQAFDWMDSDGSLGMFATAF